MAHPEDTQGQGESLSDQLTGWLHQLVDTLRDKTVRPLLFAVRGLIVGIFVATVLIVIGVVGLIGLVRLFDTSVFSGRVWATDLLFGVILLVGGLTVLRRMHPRGNDHVGH